MSELLDILITRACKDIVEELKDKGVTMKQVEAALEKKILNKVKKKKKRGIKLVRGCYLYFDSSDDENL